MRASIDPLLEIAADVPGEYWTLQHFLADLPAKWRLSFAMAVADRPVAYAIQSRKEPATCHLHHLMVHRDWRGRGLGAGMLAEMARRARAEDLQRMSLKVAAGNTRAAAFYRRHGYTLSGRDGDYERYEKPL